MSRQADHWRAPAARRRVDFLSAANQAVEGRPLRRLGHFCEAIGGLATPIAKERKYRKEPSSPFAHTLYRGCPPTPHPVHFLFPSRLLLFPALSRSAPLSFRFRFFYLPALRFFGLRPVRFSPGRGNPLKIARPAPRWPRLRRCPPYDARWLIPASRQPPRPYVLTF